MGTIQFQPSEAEIEQMCQADHAEELEHLQRVIAQERAEHVAHQTAIKQAAKVWTAEEIKANLDADPRWVARALLALHARQTAEEQGARVTREKNGAGFNGFDAGVGSSLAEWVAAGRRLTEKQLALARKIVRKYAGQLAGIANAR
jgi:hypothetical protein